MAAKERRRTAINTIRRYIGRVALLMFFCAGIFSRCANPILPQGGPIDSLPPVVIGMSPHYGATNFTQKRITIEFDEYVKLTDQSKEFFTSPFMNKKPMLTVKGKSIQIDIKDTLVENTTYALNFGSSIQDNNEGNPLNSFRYVFSTGDSIDSLVMSGYTVDALKKDSVSKTFIYFYAAEKDSVPAYDSTVFNCVVDAVGRTENNGIFVAENLKPIRYRVYAVKDNNNNNQYDPGQDDIGFLDGAYNPEDMPGFNVWYDTMRRYISADPQLYFRMFRDEAFKRHYLSGQSRPSQRQMIFSFGAPYPEIVSLELDSIPSSDLLIEYHKPTRDSMSYWIGTPAGQIPDTIKGRMIYMKHDSLNELRPDTARIRLAWKLIESKQQQKEREEKERKRQAMIEAGEEPEPEPNPFDVKVEATSPLNPEKHIGLTFAYPLVSIDTARISLVRTDSDKKFRVRFNLEQDSLNIRRYTLRAQWQNKQEYELTIPAGVFRNAAGEQNDSLSSKFSIMDPDEYATFVFDITGKTPESEYVLRLLPETGENPISEIAHARSGKHTFMYVPAGKVRLSVIEDDNCNGEWDKGNLIERRQPERVEIFIQGDGAEIEAKAGWEMEFRVDMSELFAPITMESVIEQIRKAEEVRIRKYLEEKAEREEQEKYNPSHGQGNSPQPYGGGSNSGFGGFGSGIQQMGSGSINSFR